MASLPGIASEQRVAAVDICSQLEIFKTQHRISYEIEPNTETVSLARSILETLHQGFCVEARRKVIIDVSAHKQAIASTRSAALFLTGWRQSVYRTIQQAYPGAHCIPQGSDGSNPFIVTFDPSDDL